MSDLGLSNAPVSDGIGMRPPLPPGTRPTAPDSVPRGTPGAGPVVTPQDAARQNAASTSRMPVMSTDFVFGKGRAPPPGAGQVSAEPPPGAGSDDGAPPDHPVAAGVPMTAYGSETAHRFIDWIGKNEGADWGTLYGNAVGWSGRLTTEGVPIVNGVPWKGDRGPDGRPTHAFGKGQFQPQTYVTAVREINQAEPKAPIDVTDASPINQARVALHLAQKRDPHFLDKFAAGDYRGLSSTLTNEWTSLGKYGGGSGSSGPPNLQNIALGPFNDSAKAMMQQVEADLQQGKERRDAEIARGTRLEDVAMSALQRWDDRSNHPPQNMHEAWSQWSGVAGALALLGGLGGRNMTAALAAGGTMLQAANASDERAYDKAYQQWKDHVDHGLKLSEMLFHQARNIVEDARKGYQDKVTELATLSTVHDLKEKLDPESVYNKIKELQKAKMLSDLFRANNEDNDIRLSAEAKDKEWLTANPQANGVVPPDIRNKHHGDAEQEHRGSSAAQQRLQWGQQQADAEIAATGATGDQKADIYRKYGVIPQGRGSGALKGKDAAVQAIVDAEKAVVENAGGVWDKKAEADARLKAAADYEERVARARVAAGRAPTAADRLLDYRKQRADEMVAHGMSPDEADRRAGLIPKLPQEGGDQREFIKGMVSAAEQKAAADGRPFTQEDRNQAMAEAHAEWTKQAAAGHAAGTPDKSAQKGWMILTDPHKQDETGNPVAYRYNPNTNQATTLTGEPYQPTGFQRIGTTSQGPVDKQQVDFVAKGIAEYRMAPLSGWAMNKPFGQSVMSRVVEMNPEYNAAEYRARYIGEARFTTGKQGDTIRSFGTSIDHLETMQEAADALANGNVQALNAARNRIRAELGYEGPVDFNFVKSIVGAEVSKAIIGGVGALTDREELRRGFDLMNSPEQSAGVIHMAKKLMAGQLKNLRQQASSIGWDERRFDQQLSPIARRELQSLTRSDTGAAPAAAPPAGGAPPAPGARQSPQDGKWYIDDPARPGKYLEVRP